MKNRNSTMDIFKALACIGVTLMHARFPEPVGTIARSFGCFGVPLFFGISGYYLCSKGTFDSMAILRKLKHIVNLILGAEIGYAIFSFVYFKLTHRGMDNIIESYFQPGWLERFLLTNAPPVYAHLWFLYALASIYFLILVFIRKKQTILNLSLLAPVFLICMTTQEFSAYVPFQKTVPLPNLGISIYWFHTIFLRALPFLCLVFCFGNMNLIFGRFELHLRFCSR